MAERATPTGGARPAPPELATGEPLARTRAAVVLLHGRGGTAQDMLALAAAAEHPGVAFLALQAAENSWCPYSFLAPIADNEPALSAPLAAVREALARLEAAGIPPEQAMLLGFSQGACLALEYARRHARRYGGVVGLRVGLIGPEGTPRTCHGSLAGTPIFLECSDVDPHIPRARVEHSAEVLRRLGGNVTAHLYPGMGHTIHSSELDVVRGMVHGLASPTTGQDRSDRRVGGRSR